MRPVSWPVPHTAFPGPPKHLKMAWCSKATCISGTRWAGNVPVQHIALALGGASEGLVFKKGKFRFEPNISPRNNRRQQSASRGNRHHRGGPRRQVRRNLGRVPSFDRSLGRVQRRRTSTQKRSTARNRTAPKNANAPSRDARSRVGDGASTRGASGVTLPTGDAAGRRLGVESITSASRRRSKTREPK